MSGRQKAEGEIKGAIRLIKRVLAAESAGKIWTPRAPLEKIIENLRCVVVINSDETAEDAASRIARRWARTGGL